MCWAMPRRIALIGSNVSPVAGSSRPRAGAAGAGAAATGTGGGAVRGAARWRTGAGALDDRRRALRRPVRLRRRAGGCTGAGFDTARRAARRPVRDGSGDGLGLGCAGSGLDEREDVLLRDAAADAGAGHARRVDAVLARDPGDDRRDEGSPVRRSAGAAAAGGGQPRASTGSRLAAQPRRRGLPARPVLRRPAPARRGAARLGSGGAGAAPSAAIRARIVPTSTVSPSLTRISVTTPVPGDGTSVSTLSVEISSSVSSASMCSPTCFSHLVTVPSETETPICGMTTSTAIPVAISTRSTP